MKYEVDFSIIVPTYNRADTLLVAVNSLLKQSHKSFEIIIVDDGSTDNTKEIVDQIEDKRVLYFKKENEERSIARNFGIKKAAGKYIGFLDADDYALENHLELAYQYLVDKNFPNIIHSGYKVLSEKNETLMVVNKLNKASLDNLTQENFLHCNAIVVKAGILKKYNFIDSIYATISEDRYLWMVLASRYEIDFYNKVTSVVAEHSNRSLNNLNPQKVKKSFDIIMISLLADEKVKERYGNDLKNMAANEYLFCSNIALNKKEYWLFTICLFKSIKARPFKILYRIFARLL